VDVCRKTKEVYVQLDREFNELYRILSFKREEAWWRTKLSELRRAIAGGYVVSRLDDIAFMLRRGDPGNAGLSKPDSSTEKRLAFQRLAKGLVESGLQKAQKGTLADLEVQMERLVKELNIRKQRMQDLRCDEVLAREKSSSTSATGCGVGKVWKGVESGHSMTWKRIGDSNQFIVEGTVNGQKFTAKQDTFIAGNKVTINRFQASDGNTCNFTGTINGGTASGTYTCTKYKPSSGWSATIHCN
jgi:hypothetical protein